MTRDAIRALQALLSAAGHDPGPEDGLWGARTAAAVAAWRAGRGAADEAAGPVLYQDGRHPVHHVVIHCAATRPDWMVGRPLSDKVAEIRRWHVDERRWRDIGYHWLIDRDGRVQAGRPETTTGAGVEGLNQGVIHICLIGGHGSDADDRFEDHFTPAQAVSLRQMLSAIGMRTRIDRITGHNQHARRACPGFSVPDWLKGA